MSLGVSPTLSGRVGFFSVFAPWLGGGFPEPEELLSSIPLSTTVSGVFAGSQGALTSTIPLAFAAEGRQPPGFLSLFAPWLGGGSDAGVLLGSSALAFGATGVFEGAGYMDGAVLLSFNVAAASTVSVSSLQGRFRSPLQHPGYGPWQPGTFKRTRASIVPRAFGSMLGTVSVSFNNFGTFFGSNAAIDALADAAFSASGVLEDAGTIVSTVPMALDVAGVFEGSVGELVSNITLTFSVAGAITDPGSVSSVIPLDFAAAGALKGAGAMSSNVTMQFVANGGFPNVWRPIATGSGTIWTPIRTS
jgi:hypothetical protein